MIIIGMDQGFSSIKVSSEYGDFKFANTVQEVSQTGNLFTAGNVNSQQSYEFEGKKYIVGDTAGKSGKAIHYRDVKYLLNYAPLMLAHVIDNLKQYGVKKEDIYGIGIGLPLEDISFMQEYKDKLRSFTVNNETYNIPKILCYAQGVGAYADYVYNWGKSQISSDEKGFVWDIGENTMILVSYEGYSVKKEGSRQFNKRGISAIYDMIREIVRKRIQREPDITDLRAVLSGKEIKSFGQLINFDDIIGPSVKKYLEDTYTSIMDKYGEEFSKCDKIILAGGGSIILSKYIEQVFNSNKDFFISAPHAEYSNARGYRHIIMKKLNN